MATASTTYTFTDGTAAVADEVNQNFTDVVSFLNDSVVHRDGSNAFTAVPTGPSTDPSTDNHLTRKAYVDKKAGYVVARKVHTSISEYVDGASKADFDVNFTFTVPELLSGQYLKISAMVPKFELGADSSYPEVGTALKFYLETSGGTILAYGQSSVNDALGFDETGAPSLYCQRLWTASELTAVSLDAGDTVTVKSRGAMTTAAGKFRLKGESGSPIQFAVEVV